MSFTVTPLLDGHLVEGPDYTGKSGTTVLHSRAWDAYQAHVNHKSASEEFDKAVEEFFQPLMDSIEQIEARAANPATKWNTIVLEEGGEGTKREQITLDSDGILLRILAETDGSTLRWVGDQLVAVLA